jgi:hypothetical protein
MTQKITGYRDLTEVEVGAINDCKQVANQVGELCAKIDSLNDVDKRWLAIARTDLQKGFMALVRAIARPEGF